MMSFPWSWIFILPMLLVRPGSALPISNVANIYPRNVTPVTTSSSTKSSPSVPSVEIGAIVGGVLAGIVVTVLFFAWYLGYRKRTNNPHVEEGGGEKDQSAGWFSKWSAESPPSEKAGSRFRDAFSRRGAKKSQDNILLVYQAKLPPGPAGSVSLPAPAAPNHVPRYPSILERGYSRTARHSPPLQDLSRMPSITESLRSAPAGDRASRRKVQIPPRALLVPPPGRPLPDLTGQVGASRSPRSPSKRRSWFSKHLYKHPFIPLRDDPSLRFPPSPLHPNRYQPSRQHLEARLDSRGPTEMPSRQPVRRQPVPLYVEDAGTTKHARIVEALQSSGLRTPLKTSVPHTSSKLPLNSASYI